MRSPKLPTGTAMDRYYRYYAGYTSGFVEDMFDWLKVDESASVVDPWNGSGTTTVAAAARGTNAIGFDINPVAVLIGRSRLLSADVTDSLVPLGAEICEHAGLHPVEIPGDPLSIWFGPHTTSEIRSIERAIHSVLVSEKPTRDSNIYDPQLPQSPLAAVFYVALFYATRHLVRRCIPSNAAWVKSPQGRRIGLSTERTQRAFTDSVKRLANHLAESPRWAGPDNDVRVVMGASTALPLPDASVDAVVSSPPYCTRLDYVKATLPELAVMGLGEEAARGLRDRMIGTPTVIKGAGTLQRKAWGETTNELLDRIAAHSSKASATYYSKYYTQYFTGMWDSLVELRRITKPSKYAALVLQDSYYKDIHVDLPALVGDMSRAAGWVKWERIDFRVSHTMASINPGTRKYKRPMHCVESVVILER
jgi:hypothetical protein